MTYPPGTPDCNPTPPDPDPEDGCYGVEAFDFRQGPTSSGGMVSEDRSDPEKSLGEPDRSNANGGFVSLGQGGGTRGFQGRKVKK